MKGWGASRWTKGPSPGLGPPEDVPGGRGLRRDRRCGSVVRDGSNGGERQNAKGRGGRLDAGDVAVAETALRMAGVVSGQRDPEGRLAVDALGRAIARAQDDAGGGEVAARVEGRLHGQAEPVQIVAVDLGHAEIEVRAPRQQSAGDARGIGGVARWTGRAGTPIDADRDRIEPTLRIGDGRQGFRGHLRCAGLGQGEDQIEVQQGGLQREPQANPIGSGPRDPRAPRRRFTVGRSGVRAAAEPQRGGRRPGCGCGRPGRGKRS